MKKILVFILLLIFCLLAGYYFFIYEKPADINYKDLPKELVSVNYSNFALIISQNALIRNLPEDSSLLLRFYNFNSGSREWEKAFSLKRGNVVEIINPESINPDIIILVHSKYLNELNSVNFCQIIEKANSAGDLGFESQLSDAKLLWKFKSMLSYRKCLGSS
jgi:hypothetical protein